MYNFYYEYLKPKYKDKVKLLYMDTDSFVLEIESDDFFKDTKDELKELFDTSNYHKDMFPYEYRKNASVNKRVISKMKNELGTGHMSEFIAISPKVYAYKQIEVDGTLLKEKKVRGTSKIVTKKTLCFDNYKNCLFNNEVVKWMQYRIKSTPSSIDTVQINKIALKNNDDKRLQSFNGITTFPYGTNAFKVCLEEPKIKQVFATYLNNQKLITT